MDKNKEEIFIEIKPEDVIDVPIFDDIAAEEFLKNWSKQIDEEIITDTRESIFRAFNIPSINLGTDNDYV